VAAGSTKASAACIGIAMHAAAVTAIRGSLTTLAIVLARYCYNKVGRLACSIDLPCCDG